MNSLVHVVDNVYSHDILPSVQQWANKLPICDTWYDNKHLSYASHLIQEAAKYFDLSSSIGCEMHVNYEEPKKHYDKDEKLFRTTGEIIFPLCSIVYYPFIDMEGGQIIFPGEGIAITPVTNRAIFFRGNLLHDGNPFTGVRQSIGINPWAKLPLAYEGEK